MSLFEERKELLLTEMAKLHARHELSKDMGPDFFEPGMMEHLEQYGGEYRPAEGVIVLKTEVKGLRYEDRTPRLDRLAVGDPVRILRDPENRYNPNNFTVENTQGENLGNLPAELCNAMAPPVDAGEAVIADEVVSWVERILERSRYARQGVLFLRLTLRLREHE